VVELFSTTLLCAVALLLVSLMVSTAMGYRVLIIKSGSMAPTFTIGDIVVDRSIPPNQARPGDVVTFRDPELGDQLVTHRVVSVRRSGDQIDFVTRGDANHTSESWSVPVTGSIGQTVVSDPMIGKLLSSVSTRLAKVLEIALCALLLGFLGIRWIWRQAPSAATGFIDA